MVLSGNTPSVILTVDVLLFTLLDGALHALLRTRDREPFLGRPALIGGYVHADEDADTFAAARRILAKDTGLKRVFLEQLMTFSGPRRDPRGWSASVAYYGLVPLQRLEPVLPRAAMLVPVEAPPALPFDHGEIVARGVARLRAKGAYSSLPAFLLGETFTLPQLREVYEKVLGTPLNDSAFRRKIDELRFIEPLPRSFSTASARPAQLYRLREDRLTEFDRRL